MATLAEYREILKQYWGYDSFRGVQEEIICSIGSGKDTLGLMPTGGGKSITFQVPALAQDGMCIVITPLVALMKDQVANLRNRGIRAAAIHAGLKREEVVLLLEDCIFGGYKFLYVSPERLASELFQGKLKKMKVSMVAVDESHCISQWGYDFRPAYLEISRIRELLPGVPVLALTATATPRVVDDIQDKLGFREKNVFRMSFERSNLWYIVRNTDNKTEDLLRILGKVPGSAIVYVRNRRRTKEIAEELTQAGVASTFYHAGLETEEKDRRQQMWTDGAVRVIVATNAFGMGIDKPDVRLVVHIDMPDSVEAYFQEAGRGGRDGQTAYAVLLNSPGDKRIVSKRLTDSFPEKDFIRMVYEKLAYYYQMAMGDGQGCVYEFSLSQFCQRYSLPLLPVENALRILTRMGYIEYVDEADYSARLKFVSSKEELYRLRESDSDSESVMRIVLRLYSGLFTDYVNIDEKLIATKAGITTHRLYEILIGLQRMGIVLYVPSKRTPMIVWKRARVEAEVLRFDPEAYENRMKEFQERMQAMTEYVTRQAGCRSQMLLAYFGEKSHDSCMRCDICQSSHESGMSTGMFRQIRGRIVALLSAGASDSLSLCSLPYSRERINSVLRSMLDEEELFMDDGKVRLSENLKTEKE